MDRKSVRKHFEANMLDGDKIQAGQTLSSQAVYEYLCGFIEILQDEKLEDWEREEAQLIRQKED